MLPATLLIENAEAKAAMAADDAAVEALVIEFLGDIGTILGALKSMVISGDEALDSFLKIDNKSKVEGLGK